MQPEDGDILVTWNRIHVGHAAAQVFESRGLPVLVTENSGWGNDFAGGRWLTLARNRHNTAGCFPLGDSSRWDRLGVELARWRTSGETVVLPQRGIGGDSMPRGWERGIAITANARIRHHPGQSRCVPLEDDLAHAGKVITWGSGAAIKALLWGIPVESHMPAWIGEQNNTDSGRLTMFRQLAWAQWQLDEIATGEPLHRLLS